MSERTQVRVLEMTECDDGIAVRVAVEIPSSMVVELHVSDGVFGKQIVLTDGHNVLWTNEDK